jgi:nucleoside-diphosphate-sugar epimerase
MHILLTGAAGFIGSHVAKVLCSAGHTVCGVDNLCAAYDVRLKRHRLGSLNQEPLFTFHFADVTEHGQISQLWRESGSFDAVVHLAARAGVRPSVENPWIYVDTNVTGTLNLLDLARCHGTSKFVMASTSSLYGSSNQVPFREDANTDQPLSPYAASKKGAEALCWTYHHLYGLDVTVFRYFTVYGPSGRPDMSLFRFTQWIFEDRPLRLYGDGSQSRDFTYVDDIARGTVAGLMPLGYEIINLGGDDPRDLLTLIRLIEQEAGRTARVEHHPMNSADVMQTWADIDKARRLLGWKPQTSLEEGISKLCAWYRDNREWARTIDTAD